MAKSFNDILLASGLKKLAVARMARMPLHRLTRIVNYHTAPYKHEKIALRRILCSEFPVCKEGELLDALTDIEIAVNRARVQIQKAKPNRKK